MTKRILSAAALVIVSQLAQAQEGVISPVANPQLATVEEPPAAPAVPSTPSGGFNPFRPPASSAPIVVDLPPPPPPVDPVIQALAAELQEIREKGERVGIVNGEVIFRYQGKYLVEAVQPEGLMAEGTERIDPQKREAALAGECVIQVVTGSQAFNTHTPFIQ